MVDNLIVITSAYLRKIVMTSGEGEIRILIFFINYEILGNITKQKEILMVYQ